jgi:hypothetical protein
LANPLWACAKLRKQPSVDELRLMVQTFLQPAVLKDAKPQDMANTVWALGELCRLPGWQGGVSEQDVRQLLGEQQLLLVCDNGRTTSNVVLGIARMAVGNTPIISVGYARDCSKQLLSAIYGRLGSWNEQDIANALWACGELGLVDTPFVAKAVAAAPLWLPDSLPVGLKQAVRVCAVLEYRDEAFMQACLQRGLQLLSPVRQQHANRQGGSSRPPSNGDRDDLAATCASAIARLDMQPLAGKAVELVLRSGVGQRPNTHPSNLSRLWVFHSWLLQHQLLDGKGLTGVVSQQQLQRGGAEDAAAMGMC